VWRPEGGPPVDHTGGTMTVIDRLRSAVPGLDGDSASPGPDDPGQGTRPGPGWRRGAVVGVVTGLAVVCVVLVPVLLVWSQARPDAGSSAEAVMVGAGLWLLAAGAQVQDSGATLGFTPLLGLALLVALTRVGVREAMVRVSIDDPPWWGLLPRRLAATLGAWWAGYAAVVLLVALVAAGGPLRPAWTSVLVPGLAVPVLAGALALRPVLVDVPEALGPRAARWRPPDVVRRSLGPGLAGVLALLGVGSVVVFAAVALSWDGVSAVQAGLGTAGVGSGAAVLVQVGMLPNLALWVVSFLAGPGFQVVDGATVSWSGSQSGLLPMVPVFAALPQPGPFPVATPVVGALVLVGVGVFVGRRAVRRVARLSRLRSKLSVATFSCATTATVVGLLDAVGGGSLGQFRLASVGAPALMLSLSLFGWLLLGAVIAVLRDVWALRR
jgi:hypothetical protein